MQFLKINDRQYVNVTKIDSIQVMPVNGRPDGKYGYEVQVRAAGGLYLAGVVRDGSQAETLARELVRHLESGDELPEDQ